MKITDVAYTPGMLRAICKLHFVLTIMKEHHAQQWDPEQLLQYNCISFMFLLNRLINISRTNETCQLWFIFPKN